jgi:hypothetical protein
LLNVEFLIIDLAKGDDDSGLSIRLIGNQSKPKRSDALEVASILSQSLPSAALGSIF